MFFRLSITDWQCDSSSDRETELAQELKTEVSLIYHWCRDWWYLSPAMSRDTLTAQVSDMEQKKKKQQAHKHVIDKNWEHRWSQPRESLFLCKQKVKERRGIIIHFPRRRRSGSIICFKYRSLINKSWAHIHSIQDPHSLVTINHQNTMKRFCSVLNV